jgi:hypothetical protein
VSKFSSLASTRVLILVGLALVLEGGSHAMYASSPACPTGTSSLTPNQLGLLIPTHVWIVLGSTRALYLIRLKHIKERLFANNLCSN